MTYEDVDQAILRHALAALSESKAFLRNLLDHTNATLEQRLAATLAFEPLRRLLEQQLHEAGVEDAFVNRKPIRKLHLLRKP